MDHQQKRRLLDLLFHRRESEGISLFALMDGARDPRVYGAVLESGLEHECLFAGHLVPALRAASPYLVRLLPDSAASERLVERAWGRAWGLFLAARSSLYDTRRHLRTFLRVQSEDGRYLLFRYYDPRVLRAFLPTCDAKQLRQMFGPIQRFDMEAHDSSQLLRFRHRPDAAAQVALRSWSYDLGDTAGDSEDHGGCAS